MKKAFGLLALVLTSACGRTDSIDLSSRMDVADVQRETAHIDFGTPAARPHLRMGWDIDESWNGATMVWAQGDRSLLDFYVATPRPLRLRMRCAPLVNPDPPDQTVDLTLNGAPLGRLILQPEQRDYTLPIAAEGLRRGRNELQLRYAYARRPSNLWRDTSDNRQLSVACDWLAFDGLSDPPAASVGRDDGAPSLTLPAGTEVGFYVNLPDGGTLRLDALRPLPDAGRGDAQLEVQVERDGQPAQTLSVNAGEAAKDWQAWLPGGGPVRIGLRAGGGAAAAGVVLTAPRLLVPQRPAPTPCRAARPPAAAADIPVVLYVIDTLRADHLGCYGYDRPTTPRLDAFAADAVRFANGVAQASWTRPSVASIMTGLIPPRHSATGRHSGLPTLPTLAGVLAARGYQTTGFITNSIVDAHFGMAQGFDSYLPLIEQSIPPEFGPRPDDCIQQTAAELSATVRAWIDARVDPRPPFLYLHASDPHNPYLPPSPFREALAANADLELGMPAVIQDIVDARHAVSEEERDQLIDLYDADIASMDDGFGAFLDDLRRRGLYDRALIIVTADHGEGFGRHGYYEHTRSLYSELTHVPLLVKFPQQWRAGTVVNAAAQQIDILPTVLDVLGIAPPPDLDGASLLPALTCPDAPAPPAYSAVGGPDINSEIESLVVGRHKLIHNTRTERPRPRLELYDLAADPDEQHDLATSQPVLAGYLLTRMAAYHAARPAGPAHTVKPDAAIEERMRALGY